jgi:hypothetical protein
MIIVHRKDNEVHISWASYSPLFCQEVGMIGMYLPEESGICESLARKVSEAHASNSAERHELEDSFISALRIWAEMIQEREGFSPLSCWIKEEE